MRFRITDRWVEHDEDGHEINVAVVHLSAGDILTCTIGEDQCECELWEWLAYDHGDHVDLVLRSEISESPHEALRADLPLSSNGRGQPREP